MEKREGSILGDEGRESGEEGPEGAEEKARCQSGRPSVLALADVSTPLKAGEQMPTAGN